ncbi:hypothetical protein LTR08_001355 [Meristemomyces frigidus]|nr:hypothetical protein LTR08_001355 [Meristemomyces frigidus]
MEEVHGVDVSWTTRPNENPRKPLAKPRPPPPLPAAGTPPPLRPNAQHAHTSEWARSPNPAVVTPPGVAKPERDNTTALPSTPTPSGAQKAKEKRPNILGRSSSVGKREGEGGRRASWLNNISSKFSSSSPTPTPERAVLVPTAAQPSKPTVASAPAANGTPSPMPTHAEEAEEVEPYIPSKPKDLSFFSNLTRRLSSGSTTAVPKVHGTGGMCARRVLNVDPNRERCLVPEMEPNRLRRVSFCVDVEIASGPRYVDESDEADRGAKMRDAKLKERAEGDALRRPQAAQEDKDNEGETRADAGARKAVPIRREDPKENDDPHDDDADGGASPPDDGRGGEQSSRKKEKKKQSEAERKERKEKRRKRAEENGSIPIELQPGEEHDEQTNAGSGLSRPDSTEPSASAMDAPLPVGSFPDNLAPVPSPLKQDRPTTDPVRIYRRCCQLRETPILKRITEQLMSPSCTVPFEPGIVNCLDLGGSRLQLADMVTLGDWLAVVPVRNVRLEDADINDEGVRCILAGLLAAKKPEPTKRRSVTPRHRERVQTRQYKERAGVVEKITFKNNPRISRQGWKHISLFILMCRSLKAIDLSMNQFPETLPASAAAKSLHNAHAGRGSDTDASETLYKCLAERSGGSRLEELIVSECGLTAKQIRKVVDGAVVCGISRLGLAGNHLDDEGLGHVISYLRSGVCKGLDIGGNDLRGKLGMIAEAIYTKPGLPCWGMSLAGCNLTCTDLKALFPALVKLPDFRFIDLSHNRALCTNSDDTVSLFRRTMASFTQLKRIHLADVGMSPKQAIALADCLPDGERLAHINLLENPMLQALASARDETGQEEACAVYASLMAAVRVSSTLICIDLDIPSADNSEVVKALAKQVVAYSLRNMEQFAIAEATGVTPVIGNAAAKLAQPHGGEKMLKEITVPDVLMDLVGHVDGSSTNHDSGDPAPDDDYIVGGTGVVRALQYVLGEKANDMRRSSAPSTPGSGSVTPRDRPGSSTGLPPTEEQRGKARKMSKNLLDSARKIRSRLQPALVKESTAGDELAYRRLLFLDQTLQSMIQRFEEEYPETRLAPADASEPAPRPMPRMGLGVGSGSTMADRRRGRADLSVTTQGMEFAANGVSDDDEADAEADDGGLRPGMKRTGSEVSLAGRALSLEEGRLHRLGQSLRRGIIDSPVAAALPHDAEDTARQDEHARIKALGEKLEAISGIELKAIVEREGWPTVLRTVGANYDDLRRLQEQDPEGWEQLKESQIKARMNLDRDRPASRGAA